MCIDFTQSLYITKYFKIKAVKVSRLHAVGTSQCTEVQTQ